MSLPEKVVVWKWKGPDNYRSTFGPEQVNVCYRMVQRNFPHPHTFACVTDDAEGIDPAVEIIPPWNDFADLPAPNGGKNPSCYRRLRAFHPEIGQHFGRRFVMLDLDCVITADLTPLWNRPEPFVIWGDYTNPRTAYNGSMVLMDAGARSKVWTEFNPNTSPLQAKSAGMWGSDQGWISFILGTDEARWRRSDGVYSFRNDIQPAMPSGGKLPPDARIVMFHGNQDPWGDYAQKIPWIKEHWR